MDNGQVAARVNIKMGKWVGMDEWMEGRMYMSRYISTPAGWEA